jgi:hypothetical protein
LEEKSRPIEILWGSPEAQIDPAVSRVLTGQEAEPHRQTADAGRDKPTPCLLSYRTQTALRIPPDSDFHSPLICCVQLSLFLSFYQIAIQFSSSQFNYCLVLPRPQ